MRLLFDDVVGAGKDRWRDGRSERFGGLEIDGGPVLAGEPVLGGVTEVQQKPLRLMVMVCG